MFQAQESFEEDLRTVNDTLCLTYRDSCLQRGLPENDNVHHLILEEASVSVSPKQLRQIFDVMLNQCGHSNPVELWSRHCTNMSEDFAHSFNLENDHIAFHRALAELENFVTEMGGNQLVRYGLPQPERDAAERAEMDYRRETPYSVDTRRRWRLRAQIVSTKNSEPYIMNLLLQQLIPVAGCIFRCSRRIWKNIPHADCIGNDAFTIKKIAIATARSGLAATLIPGGCTIYSTFKAPLNMMSLFVQSKKEHHLQGLTGKPKLS